MPGGRPSTYTEEMGEEIVFIYALCCPMSGDIRYVGKTKNLRQRYSQHTRLSEFRRGTTRKQSWISSIIKSGEKPILFVLEECLDSDWPDREVFWIKEMKRRGFDLVNGTAGGDMPPIGMGRAKKGRKEDRLTTIIRNLAINKAWLEKRNMDASKTIKSINTVNNVIKEMETKLGKGLGRAYINMRLEEMENAKAIRIQ